MRLFVAVELPEALLEAIGALQAPLRRFGAAVSWARPAGCHGTLKFLGEVDPERRAAIEAALAPVAAHAPSSCARAGWACSPAGRDPA